MRTVTRPSKAFEVSVTKRGKNVRDALQCSKKRNTYVVASDRHIYIHIWWVSLATTFDICDGASLYTLAVVRIPTRTTCTPRISTLMKFHGRRVRSSSSSSSSSSSIRYARSRALSCRRAKNAIYLPLVRRRPSSAKIAFPRNRECCWTAYDVPTISRRRFRFLLTAY